MTVAKAIETLEYLKSTIPTTDQEEKVWLIQSRSFIKSFFGDNSHEYSFINNFSFHDSVKKVSDFWAGVKSYDPNPDRPKVDHKLSASTFLDNCIQTIKINGLYKDPKKEFLNKYSDKEIIGTFIASLIFVGGLCYTIGQIVSSNKIEKLEIENQKLKDSISGLRAIPTNTKSNNVSQVDTGNTKKSN
jgi:hypothetical protein